MPDLFSSDLVYVKLAVVTYTVESKKLRNGLLSLWTDLTSS